jgi:voltage-gated potassium channel
MHLPRHLLLGIGALILLIFIGTAGYMLVEEWSFSDSIFMTIISISTVGYSEIHPLSSAGRVFTIFLIVAGVGLAFYILTSVVQNVIEQGVQGVFRRQSMENRISRLKDHFIICGYGRVGKEVAAVFSENKVPFVVIDPSDAASADAAAAGYLFLQGDACSDEVLKKAEIGRSRGLIAATEGDAENVFITLSAKALCPGLLVVARTYSEETVAKLERAGADRVVAPLRQGGRRMAMLALRPLAVDFVDAALGRGPSSLELEHIKVVGSSPLASRKVGEGEKLTGVTILVLRKKSGDVLPKPDAEALIETGDELFVIGVRKQLEKVEEVE